MSIEGGSANYFNAFKIYCSIGQLIRKEEIAFKNNTTTIKTNMLANGVHIIKLIFNSQNGLSLPDNSNKYLIFSVTLFLLKKQPKNQEN